MLALQRPFFENRDRSVGLTRRPARWPPRRLLLGFVLGLLVVSIAGLQLSAAEPLRTFDGKHDISRIQVTVVYFVPCDRPALPDWETRLRYYCRRIERFHAREFQGQSTLATTIHPQPFVSRKNSTELRSGDRDFIFFQTLEEVEHRLSFVRREQGPFPILLVLSDINWRELDDFYRLRAVDGQFEGQIIEGRHFPGAASGGARSLYLADRGVGWGLVSADGWRVPYTGSDCVAYHEGVGHPIGLPHPEPVNGSVMSVAQYQFWINQSWIDEAQKRRLGWLPPHDDASRQRDLFSVFTAIPKPLIPQPSDEVALQLTWPAEARIRRCAVQLQTELFGPWYQIPIPAPGPAPDSISLGRFDRPTPVSYRVDATLEDGQDVEVWGYFQVRTTPAEPPLPPRSNRAETSAPAARWAETIDLLPLVDPERDRVSGQWTGSEGRLESNKQYGARIEIPYQPPAEYVMTAVVEPLDEPNGLIVGQRSGDRRFLVLVNYQRPEQPPASALENVDDLNVDRNGTVVHAPLLTKDRPSTLVCTVRTDSVTVTCDGRPLIDWQGGASRLSLSDYWQTPHPEMLFLGAYDCRYRFHRVTLTPISGTGKRLNRENPPPAEAQPAGG
jgi:hypothetical protein